MMRAVSYTHLDVYKRQVKGVDEMSQDEYRKAAIEAVKKLSVDVGIPTKLEAIKEMCIRDSCSDQRPDIQPECTKKL